MKTAAIHNVKRPHDGRRAGRFTVKEIETPCTLCRGKKKENMNRVSLLISTLVLLTLARSGTALGQGRNEINRDLDQHGHHPATNLYVWAGDQARMAPDFLAVLNFDEDSDDYGKEPFPFRLRAT